MNEDFTVLRETMGKLSEHGGDADLHDRMLRTSRRITRRNRIGATVAAAVAIGAMSVPFALAGTRGSAPGPDVVATDPSVTTSQTSTPTPPSTPPSSPAASSSSPPSSTVTTSQNGCPVTAQQLFDAAATADGPAAADGRWRDIECHDGWASAWFVQKVKTGDPGATVFKWNKSAGNWVVVGNGSGEYCTAYLPRGKWGAFTKACAGADPSQPCPTGNTETIEAIEASRWADDVKSGDFVQELDCGDKYAVQQLVGGAKKTFVMRWDSGRDRWTAIAAGSCKAVVKSPYGDPSLCG